MCAEKLRLRMSSTCLGVSRAVKTWYLHVLDGIWLIHPRAVRAGSLIRAIAFLGRLHACGPCSWSIHFGDYLRRTAGRKLARNT